MIAKAVADCRCRLKKKNSICDYHSREFACTKQISIRLSDQQLYFSKAASRSEGRNSAELNSKDLVMVRLFSLRCLNPYLPAM